MTRRRTLLAAITAGTAGVSGCLGILGGGGTAETGPQRTIDDGTTETGSQQTIDDGTGTLMPTQTGPVQFNVIDGEITKCGTACRTFNYTVQNTGSEAATGVEARLRVYTPDIDGEQVYNNTQEIGDIDPGTEVPAVKDIDVGLVDGNTIRNNDGDIDIRVNLSSDQGATAEFVFDRKLSD